MNNERSCLRMSWKEANGFLQGQDSVMPLGDTPLPVLSNIGFNYFLSITDSTLHGQLSHSTFLNLVTLKGGLVFQRSYFTFSHQPALDFIIIPFPRFSWLHCCQPFHTNKSHPPSERYCGTLDPTGVSCSSEMSLLMKSRTLQSTLYNIPQFIN
jgi:hypothetical protein